MNICTDFASNVIIKKLRYDVVILLILEKSSAGTKENDPVTNRAKNIFPSRRDEWDKGKRRVQAKSCNNENRASAAKRVKIKNDFIDRVFLHGKRENF